MRATWYARAAVRNQGGAAQPQVPKEQGNERLRE